MSENEIRRVLITGSRNWSDTKTIIDALRQQLLEAKNDDEMLVVVHGDCPTGADFIASQWCAEYRNVIEEKHPANWEAYGKSAGPIRNQEMVDLGAVVCLAFPHADSRGTKHCMRAAQIAGIPVVNFGTKF